MIRVHQLGAYRVIIMKKKKISFLLWFLSTLLRFFFVKKGVFCFVATNNKPWGCNMEAFCHYTASLSTTNRIYILNFSDTLNSEIMADFFGCPVPVTILSETKGLQALFCLVHPELFFLNDYSTFRVPGRKINLWHGVPLKKIGVLQNKKHKALRRKFSNVVSAKSEFDRKNMAQAFNMPLVRVIASGLPRHDWVSGSMPMPPSSLAQLETLKKKLNGKKLVLYAPTFRDGDVDALPICEDKLKAWAQLLHEYNYVLGVRCHLITRTSYNFESLDVLDLSSGEFKNIEVIYSLADVLVTDYSGVSIDFMLTCKPILGLDLSKNSYKRGFMVDFDSLFPGLFHKDWMSFTKNMTDLISGADRYFDYSSQRIQMLGNYSGEACKELAEELQILND